MNEDIIEGYLDGLGGITMTELTDEPDVLVTRGYINHKEYHFKYNGPEEEPSDSGDQWSGTDLSYGTKGVDGQPGTTHIPNTTNKLQANDSELSDVDKKELPDEWLDEYENAEECYDEYSMPQIQRKFISYKVECIIKDILEAKLRRVKYDPQTCSSLTKDICALIKEKTKEFEFDRYKLVTQVLLGEDSDESVQIATRCLWNQDTDNFAAATFRNEFIYAVAIVYGLYLDE